MRPTALLLSLALALAHAAPLAAAERINHAGRILGDLPAVAAPTLFNTATADAVVAAMQIMPRDNPWNEDVSARPLHASSAAIMVRIRSDLVAVSSARRTLRVFPEMNYVLVPPGQALADLRVVDYPDESDLNGGTSPVARYPIPANWPIEGWPSGRPGETLEHAQRTDDGGDRHGILVDAAAGRIFETWRTQLTTGAPAWICSGAALFDLASNGLRPDGWTSADAAGLPMFPALIRYDEVQRGEIEHALRVVCYRTRRAYIYPATHYASSLTAADLPAMGQRLRLKAGFSIPAGWSRESQTVARALQRYGALVADNGGFFSVSACPDDRFPSGCFDDVQSIDIDQFEVVAATGPGEGPRSPGAPTVDAGADRTVALAAGASLAAAVAGSGIQVAWYLYDPASAPGTVTFSAPTAAATTAMFSALGVYRLMCRVADGVHTPAFDVVTVTVTADGTGGGTSTSAATGNAEAAPLVPPRTAGIVGLGSGGGSGGCGLGGLGLLLALGAGCWRWRRRS